MKLQCQIEVINRKHVEQNVRTKSKYVKSTLALGKEPKLETEYFILHFSTVNKSGTKYRVKNLKQVFVKYINEGKTTLRFDEPPNDLCIKSEVIQLKCFMKLLKSCITGDDKALQLAPLSSLSVTANDNAPTKLVVRDRSEFPSKGLPRTLQSLCLRGLNLCNFRRDILLLKQLTVLNLSDNQIEKLPPEFGRMPALTELYLANNQLGIHKVIDWRWLLGPQITQSLKLLDLRGNKLNSLPVTMWKLGRLVTLNLDNNELQKLPASIGRLANLKYITVSNNKLQSLPCGIVIKRYLYYIDISGNNFWRTRHEAAPKTFTENVEKLVDICAKVVVKQNIYYAPNIIPASLVQFLDEAAMCFCGAPAFSQIPSYDHFDLKYYVRDVVSDEVNRGSALLECHLCSKQCFFS